MVNNSSFVLKNRSEWLITLIIMLSGFISFSQDKGTGLIYDPEVLKQLPKTAPILTRGLEIPKSISLKQFAPTPGDQGSTSTCVAWAAAYHGRTIAESYRLGRTDLNEINENTFSPSYIYNQIRMEDNCSRGTYVHEALELMMDKGAAKFKHYGFDCEREPGNTDHQNAQPFKIMDYKLLFLENDFDKITPVKLSLANHYPVIFAMNTPPSFYPAMMNGNPHFQPTIEDYNYQYGTHAMLLIGYDDNKYGGAFLLMNSWGTEWGDGGYAWISYEDWQEMALYAYEMVELPAADVDMQGSLYFTTDAGKVMESYFSPEQGIYIMSDAYPSGTNFRFYIDNHEPAYVYAFGSDDTKKSYRIFPHDKYVSPYLGYRQNRLAFPSENHYVTLDDNKGHDFFCVLYSKEPLDYEKIMREMERTYGTFMERLERVLGEDLVPQSHIKFEQNQILFNARSGDKKVIALVVEFEHI